MRQYRESATIRGIQRYHMDGMYTGWDDIGYHAGIEKVRDVPVVLLGRPEDRMGAHASGHNDRTLGFCFVGQFDDDPPDQELLEVAAQRWFVPVMARYRLGLDDLVPHRQLNRDKTCPGLAFDMDTLRETIAAITKG